MAFPHVIDDRKFVADRRKLWWPWPRRAGQVDQAFTLLSEALELALEEPVYGEQGMLVKDLLLRSWLWVLRDSVNSKRVLRSPETQFRISAVPRA